MVIRLILRLDQDVGADSAADRLAVEAIAPMNPAL
jgi:hypothetical protein